MLSRNTGYTKVTIINYYFLVQPIYVHDLVRTYNSKETFDYPRVLVKDVQFSIFAKISLREDFCLLKRKKWHYLLCVHVQKENHGPDRQSYHSKSVVKSFTFVL